MNPPEGQIPRYLLRDRDKIFGADFRQQVADLKVKEVLAAPGRLGSEPTWSARSARFAASLWTM